MSTLALFPGVVLPTAEEEIWRYSRIEELDLNAFIPGRLVNDVRAEGDSGAIVTVGASVDECGIAMPLAVDAFAEINAIQCSSGCAGKISSIGFDGMGIFIRLISL